MPILPEDGRVLVVGLGKLTGTAVAEELVKLGVEVRVTEIAKTPQHLKSQEQLREKGILVELGEPNLDWLQWADLVIPSPGVPPASQLLLEAARRGIKIWSEIELGWRLALVPVLAVTGTNGKTTTTTLLTDMLCRGGKPAVAAGNIGVPLVKAAVSAARDSHLVCEVSSFQLAFIEAFRPDVAVILNIADDHYDWHNGYEDYVAAKARICENQHSTDLLLVSGSDPGALAIAASSRSLVGIFGPDEPDLLVASAEKILGRKPVAVGGISEGRLAITVKGHVQSFIDVGDIRLQGTHNLQNVLAAAMAAVHVGVDSKAVSKTLRTFDNLPHRSSRVAEIKGVRYVDDSKATNPHATLSALKGLDRVVLIAGGRSKGLRLSVLSVAASKIKKAVVMGEAQGELETVFGKEKSVRAADVEEAVRRAFEVAEPGDTVLLSPACSSLDQYADYAERGERFVKAVMSLAG